jgi:hypothetical protein
VQGNAPADSARLPSHSSPELSQTAQAMRLQLEESRVDLKPEREHPLGVGRTQTSALPARHQQCRHLKPPDRECEVAGSITVSGKWVLNRGRVVCGSVLRQEMRV